MGRRGIAVVASIIGLSAAALVARGDDDLARKIKGADRSIGIIDLMTTNITNMLKDAQEHRQAMRGSCLDVQLKAARDNQQVAHNIRKNLDPAQTSADYIARSLERLDRLQVYAMVFENEARGCATAEAAARDIPGSAASGRGPSGPSSPSGPIVVDIDAPPLPRLERPPLASPY